MKNINILKKWVNHKKKWQKRLNSDSRYSYNSNSY